MTSLAEHWGALATVGLLGTDRRPSPEPPPGALRDLLDAQPPPDHAASVLEQVAAVAAARRAGLRPLAPIARPEPCPDDERPLVPFAAARRLPELLESFPILVDEWLALVSAAGRRLPPQVTVALLARYRNDAARRAVVIDAAGPLADWIVTQFPAVLGARRGPTGAPAPLPSEFAQAITAPSEEAVAFVGRVASDRARAKRDHSLLVRVVAAVDVSSLPAHGDALEALARAGGPTTPYVLGLLDLARARAAMIAELA